MGKIPQRRVSAPVGLQKKARRHVCINIFMQVPFHLGAYIHYPSSGAHLIIGGFLGCLRVGAHPIIEAHGWMYIETASEWGHIPSSGDFLGCLRVGISYQSGMWVDSCDYMYGSQEVGRSSYTGRPHFTPGEAMYLSAGKLPQGEDVLLEKPCWISSFRYLRRAEQWIVWCLLQTW